MLQAVAENEKKLDALRRETDGKRDVLHYLKINYEAKNMGKNGSDFDELRVMEDEIENL